jgi:hypothetical protein
LGLFGRFRGGGLCANRVNEMDWQHFFALNDFVKYGSEGPEINIKKGMD